MALNRGYEYRDRIGSAWRGISVLTYLTTRYRHSPETAWRQRLERGEISIDGIEARPDAVMKGGEWLLWRRPPWEEPYVPLEFAVLYRDESILAVAKPSGLPTLPAGGFLEHTLLARVRRMDENATPVHRLGRGTSGVVLFARTQQARTRIASDFRENRITKIYRALALGNPETRRFVVDARIGPVPHPRLQTVHGASARGRPARSEVRVLQQRPGASLLEVRIQTGRPHQIRVHLAFAGYPLVGDPLYTVGGLPGSKTEALPGDIGYRLHAERLILQHPATDAQVELWCSPPPDLESLDS